MSAISTKKGFVTVKGGRVWYRIEGAAQPGIPLLTLHGGPGAPSDYIQSLADLADERPVILYDQLGSGRSDRPDDPNLWVLDRFVDEVAHVVSALGLTRFHLFGHSAGTMLAVEYALRQPSGLVSLILSGPAISAARYVRDATALKDALPIEMQEAINRHEAAGTLDASDYQAAVSEWMSRSMCRSETVRNALAPIFSDPDTGQNGQIYSVMWGISEWTMTGNLKDFDRTAFLHEIRVPTLFTCGRYDATTPEATTLYQSQLPGSELVIFERSAHMTHLEEREQFMQTLRDFLHRVEGHREE